MKSRFFYFYYHTSENFRKINLIPRYLFSLSKKSLNDLEGFLITEKEVSQKDLEFSITKDDDLAKKYKGEFHKFDDYK
jgi:hypothetical protein